MHYAIIAAGEGSRLAQEGVARPKPLVELAGEPMIGRLIGLMSRCGAESVSVIVNERMTDVQEYLRSLDIGVPFNIVVKSTPSSMHSFAEVSRVFPPAGKFVLTTVDTIFREEDFRAYARAFAESDDADGYMGVTTFIDDEKPLYIDVDEEDMSIKAFCDEPWDGVRYISGGIYGLTPPALDVLRDCIDRGVSRMRNYQRALVDGGLKLKAYPFSKIVDVDHAGDIATAERFIKD